MLNHLYALSIKVKLNTKLYPNLIFINAVSEVTHPALLLLCLNPDDIILPVLFLQDGVMVLSATHRYKKKYVTSLLYKPI